MGEKRSLNIEAPPMKTYSVEWAGMVTHDIGWETIQANSPEEAYTKFLREHGQYRRIRGISEVLEGEAARTAITKAE